MIGKILKFVLRWVLVLLVFGFVLEVAARIDDWFTWDAPILANYTHETLRVADSLGFHNRAGAKYQKWEINSYGFRGREITKEKPDSVTRIVIVGASESFGLLESHDMEYPAQMQRILDSISPGRYEVLNAACPGMTPPRIELLFKKWIIQFEPDIVVYYPSPAFYLGNNPVPDSLNVEAMKHWRPKKALRIKDKARIVIKGFVPHEIQTAIKKYLLSRNKRDAVKGWSFESVPEDRLELFEKHLRALATGISQLGVPLILSTHGNRFGDSLDLEDEWNLEGSLQYYPKASREIFLAFDPAANRIIKNVAKEQNLPYVDIELLVPKGGEYFADAGHFTDKGAGLMARYFVDRILVELKKEKSLSSEESE